MKIAVIGSGGREHAISDKLSQSLGWENVFTLPGNAGISNSHKIETSNFEEVKQFCEANSIDLIFVGPEIPLTNGIVDFFNKSPIKVFGPDKHAAQLEGSKIWSKNFMNKYGIKTAESQSFQRIEDSKHFIQEKNGNIVIKYDGLAGGKGVYVCSSIDEASEAFQELSKQYGKEFPFLVEDKISGDEISIIGFTDGKRIKLLQPSQDHKQLLDNDVGPNTGGMGAYCPVPFCDDLLMQKIDKAIIQPTLEGFQKEKLNYVGIVYFGLMIDNGEPYVLEYNVRLGDPETEVILPALKTDLATLLLACFDNTLDELELEFNEGYFVDVVLTSGGYPKSYEKGFKITGLDKINNDTKIYHAGTSKKEGKFITNGGRVLNIVCQGANLEEAIKKTYQECDKINFQNKYNRTDIGNRKVNLSQNK